MIIGENIHKLKLQFNLKTLKNKSPATSSYQALLLLLFLASQMSLENNGNTKHSLSHSRWTKRESAAL